MAKLTDDCKDCRFFINHNCTLEQPEIKSVRPKISSKKRVNQCFSWRANEETDAKVQNVRKLMSNI